MPTGIPTPEKREAQTLEEYIDKCEKNVLIASENLEEELRVEDNRGQFLLSSAEGGLNDMALYYIDKENNFVKVRIKPWEIGEFKKLNLGDNGSYWEIYKKLEELGFSRKDGIVDILAKHRDEIMKEEEYKQNMIDIEIRNKFAESESKEKKPFNF